MAKPSSGPKTADEIALEFQKNWGEEIGGYGVRWKVKPRLPTGIFAFDLATGGGFPRGAYSVIYGPEGSGKTNLILKAIGHHQKMFPKLTCAFVDLEQSVEEPWAQAMGVDTSKWLYFRPDYAEQAADMVEALLYAEDIGVVAFDSVAAMMSLREIEKSAEDSVVGRGAIVTQIMIKKALVALGDAMKHGRFPTLLLINQIRYKIGVMRGDPRKMPGGEAVRFFATMIARIWAKDVRDPKIHELLPIRKHTDMILEKHKVRVTATHADWDLTTVPHQGRLVGETSDWSLLSTMLKDDGLLVQSGKKWLLEGAEFSTLKAMRAYLVENPDVEYKLRDLMIEKRLEETTNPVGESTKK